MPRGSLSTKKAKLVAFWMPLELLRELDLHVSRDDLDRSKVIRSALKEKLKKLSPCPTTEKAA